MSDLPICACEQFWPNEGHHPDCPVRHEIERLRARLAEAERLLAELRDFEDDLAVRKIDAFLADRENADE